MISIVKKLIKQAIDEGQQHVDAMTDVAAQALLSTKQGTAEGAALAMALLQAVSSTARLGGQALGLHQRLFAAMCSSNSTVMEAAVLAIDLWWQHLEEVWDEDDAVLQIVEPMLQQAAAGLQQHCSVGAAAYIYMARWVDVSVVQPHVPVLLAALQEAAPQQNGHQQQQQGQQAICKVLALAALVHMAGCDPDFIAAHDMPSWLRLWLSDLTTTEDPNAVAAAVQSGNQPAEAGTVNQATVTAAEVHPAVSGLLQALLAALSCKNHQILLRAACFAVTDAALVKLLLPAMAMVQQQCLQALQAVQGPTENWAVDTPRTAKARLHLWGMLATALPTQQLQQLLLGLLQQLAGAEHAAAARAAALLRIFRPAHPSSRVLYPDHRVADALLASDNMQLLLVLQQGDDPDLSVFATDLLIHSLTNATAGKAEKTIAQYVGMYVARMQQGEASAGALIARLAAEARGRALLRQWHEQALVDTMLRACQQHSPQHCPQHSPQQPQQQLFGSVGVCSLAALCELVEDGKQLPVCDQQLPQWLKVWLLGRRAALQQDTQEAASSRAATGPGVAVSASLVLLKKTAAGTAAADQARAGGLMQIPVVVMSGIAAALSTPAKHALHQAAQAATKHVLKVAPHMVLAAVIEAKQLEYFLGWPETKYMLPTETIAAAAPQLLHAYFAELVRLMLVTQGEGASKAAAAVIEMVSPYHGSSVAKLAAAVCKDACQSLALAMQHAEPTVADAALSMRMSVAAKPDVPRAQLTLGSMLMQQVQEVCSGNMEAAERLCRLAHSWWELHDTVLPHIAALMATMTPRRSRAAAVQLLQQLASVIPGRPAIAKHRPLLQLLLDALQDESAQTASRAACALHELVSDVDNAGKSALLALPQGLSQLLQAALPGHLTAAMPTEQRKYIKLCCITIVQAADALVRSDAAFLQAALEHVSLLLAAMQQSCLPEVAAAAGRVLGVMTASRQGATSLCEDRYVSGLVDLLQWQQGAALKETAQLIRSVACQPAGTPLLSTRKRFEMILNTITRHSDSSNRTANTSVATVLLRALSSIAAPACSGATAASRQQPQALIKSSHVRQLVQVAQQPALAVDVIAVLACLLNSDQYKLMLFPYRDALQMAAQQVKDSSDAALEGKGAALVKMVISMNQAVTIAFQMTHRNVDQAWRSYVEAAEHFAKLFVAYRAARRDYCSLSQGQRTQLPGSSAGQTFNHMYKQQKRMCICLGNPERAVACAARDGAGHAQSSIQEMPAEQQQQQQQSPCMPRQLAKQELDTQYDKAVAPLQALVERCNVHYELHQQLQGAMCVVSGMPSCC